MVAGFSLCVFSALAQSPAAARPAAMNAASSSTGFTAHDDREALEVSVCGDALIHVTSRPLGAAAGAEAQPPEAQLPEDQPWMLAKTDACPGASFQFSQANGTSTLATSRLTVTLSDHDGNLTVKTLDGET